MAQTTYETTMPLGQVGVIADAGYTNVLSPMATAEIAAGLAVCKVVGQDMQVRLPLNNLATLTFSGALVASNVINGKVNGVAIAPVTYASSSADTMTAIANAIEDIDGVVSATVNSTVITIVMDNETPANVSDWVVTLGVGQATVALVNSTSDTLYGVALLDESRMNAWAYTGSAGMLPYQVGECVPDLTKGRVIVQVEDTLNSDDPVYVRFIAGTTGQVRGNFRSDSDSGKAFLVPSYIARWIKGASAGGLAVLEVELP